MSWEEGYVVDTPYTYGYYPEMAPNRVRYAMTQAGWEPPPPGPCCELGFGQGVSLNLSAAANPACEWWGNDFNPAQARFARSLSESGGTRTHLTDAAFADFCSRDDLPEFGLITIHGIWSWISRENQRVILDFVSRRLALGGVLYISYNTQPGWAAMAPVRQLFNDYARAVCAPSLDSVKKMQQAIEFVDRVLGTNPPFQRMNPSIKPKIEGMRKHSASYLPHEYLNTDWSLTTFSELAGDLEGTKLQHAGNAGLLERIELLHLDDDQRKLLAELGDLRLRETVRDFICDTSFRRDYFIKGGQRLSAARVRAAAEEQELVLAALPDKVPADVKCSRGKWELKPEIYQPILAALDAQERPIARGELAERLAREKSIPPGQYHQAMSILVAIGAVQPAQSVDLRAAAAPACERLNARILADAAEDFRVGHLVSPVTGLGVSIDFVSQLILGAKRSGLSAPEAIARYARDAMAAQNQRLRVGGKLVDDPDEAMERLTRMATDFDRITGGVLARMGLI